MSVVSNIAALNTYCLVLLAYDAALRRKQACFGMLLTFKNCSAGLQLCAPNLGRLLVFAHSTR